MGVIKKIFKVIGRILLVLLILYVITFIVCFFYQKSAQKKERKLLEDGGYKHLYSAGDYNMNINIYGEGENKIVVMPGSGHAEFTVDMKKFAEHLSDDISLVVVTRPGYGLCEETDHRITTEYIVDSTRTALKNAGVEAPYILMPHSLSGIYGTYWENTYPEEVKAFNDIMHSGDDADEYTKYANAMYDINPTAFSKSFVNEMKNYNKNANTAWASIKSNDIPKIYISTNYQTIDDIRDYLMFMDGEVDEAKAQEWFEDEKSAEKQAYYKKRSEYINKLGNCKEINIAGSHFIHEQKPDEVAKTIEDFVNGIK